MARTCAGDISDESAFEEARIDDVDAVDHGRETGSQCHGEILPRRAVARAINANQQVFEHVVLLAGWGCQKHTASGGWEGIAAGSSLQWHGTRFRPATGGIAKEGGEHG